MGYLNGSFRGTQRALIAALCAVFLGLSLSGCRPGEKTDADLAVRGSVDRPPQYVLMAFDGSKTLSMWRDTVAFASDFEKSHPGKKLKFTYFVSGVYWLSSANKKKYRTPTRAAGSSAIGWAKSNQDILSRIKLVNRAIDNGHEIASHANGHFGANDSGHVFKTKEWRSEFSQFDKFIFDTHKVNGISGGPTLNWSKSKMVGFRAPQLAMGHPTSWRVKKKDLYSVLNEFGFRYDTSRTSKPNYWPEITHGGIWNFPLASFKIVTGFKSSGAPIVSNRKTLSMDYNFLVGFAKRAGKSVGSFKKMACKRCENDTYYTYKNYFNANYKGNRAPVHIGHHFSRWNKGAYWAAMKRFAKEVCGLPEVICGTNVEYADFLDRAKKKGTYEAYRKGSFAKMPSTGDGREFADWGPLDDVESMSYDELRSVYGVAHDHEE